MLVSVRLFVRTLLRVQSPLLAPSCAFGAQALGDARGAARAQPAPARREEMPIAQDAMQRCRKKTFSSKCQLLRFWVWGFF